MSFFSLLFLHIIFSFIVYLLGTIFVLYAPLTKQILENRIDIFRKQNFSFPQKAPWKPILFKHQTKTFLLQITYIEYANGKFYEKGVHAYRA